MTSPSDLDLSSSVNVSTQTLGETIYQFIDLPGLPSIQERIIHTQDDQVKKALADLGWICPQEAKAMRGYLAAKDTEIANLKRGPTPDYTGEGSDHPRQPGRGFRMMAVIGEIALLVIASWLIVAGIFGAWIGCAMDSSGSVKHLWILLAAVIGVALGAAAIHYGPIAIQIRANQGGANG